MKTITFFICFLVCLSVSAQDYYVAPTGTDTPSAGTLANPWRSFQYAISQVSAGATVYFRGGVYPSSYVVINKNGNAGNYIKFKNYPNEVPIIDGGNSLQTLLRITDQSYIIIDGLHFRNVLGNGSRGIFVEGTSHHIEVRNCKISNMNVTLANPYNPTTCSDNVSPIKFCGTNDSQAMTNITVANNEIFSCRTGCSEGLTFSGNIDGFVAENNDVHDISNIGIVAAGHYYTCGTKQAQNGKIINNKVYRCRFPNLTLNNTASGIYIDGGKNITAEYNIVYDCQVGMQIGCENAGKTASNDTVRNNIVFNNEKWGIGIGGFNGFVENSAVINNTLFKNNYFNNNGDFGEILLQKVSNSAVINNLCYIRFQTGNAVFMKMDFPNDVINLTVNNNLYYNENGAGSLLFVRYNLPSLTFDQYKSTYGYDANAQTSNPNLVNPNLPMPDLHLTSNSTATIGTGASTYANKAGNLDFEGNPRRSNTIDIGAYEYQPCPPYSKIWGNSPANSYTFSSSVVTTSTSQIQSNSRMNYRSVKTIELQKGFSTQSGAVFSAQIAGCGNN
jgi:hypothetical protein